MANAIIRAQNLINSNLEALLIFGMNLTA